MRDAGWGRGHRVPRLQNRPPGRYTCFKRRRSSGCGLGLRRRWEGEGALATSAARPPADRTRAHARLLPVEQQHRAKVSGRVRGSVLHDHAEGHRLARDRALKSRGERRANIDGIGAQDIVPRHIEAAGGVEHDRLVHVSERAPDVHVGAGVVGHEGGVIPAPRSLDRPAGWSGRDDLTVADQDEGEAGEDELVHDSTESYPGNRADRHNRRSDLPWSELIPPSATWGCSSRTLLANFFTRA